MAAVWSRGAAAHTRKTQTQVDPQPPVVVAVESAEPLVLAGVSVLNIETVLGFGMQNVKQRKA